MFYPIDDIYMLNYPYIENHMPSEKPPTLYAVLDSLVNYGKDQDERVKITDLASAGRDLIFDFDYYTFPKDTVDDVQVKSGKEKFIEDNILEHFLERRIGFATVTSFKIHLKNKMNELMPLFIPNFNVLVDNPDEFYMDEYKYITHNETTSNDSSGSTKDKYSDTPQGQLTNVSSDTYLTDYREVSISGDEDGTRDFTESYETIHPRDSYMQIMQCRSLLDKLYRDLECLFYQLD